MNNEMLEKLKTYLNNTKAALGKVSKRTWILAAVVLVALAAGITIFLYTRPYSIFITGATNEEMSTAMTWLRGQGVSYRVDGDTITVPSSLAHNLKASWLVSDVSGSGTYKHGYFFDNISALSTEAERNAVSRFDLQEELAAVIRSFDGVQEASVTINTGEDMTYVLDSGRVDEPSASVKVTMRPGRTLDNKVALAIRNYVAGGIKGLSVGSVYITDNYGNTYNALSSDDYISSSALKTQMEEDYENKKRTQLTDMFSTVYGPDNVRVAVNAVVAVQHQIIDDHSVSIPDYIDGRVNGEGIIKSRIYSYKWLTDDERLVGGIVGTTTNSDIDIPNVVENPDIDYSDYGIHQGNGQIDYDPNTTDTHTINTAGYLEDLTVTVYINSTTVQTPVDIAATRRAVATAVGITPVATETMTADEYLSAKISVVSQPFYVAPVTPPAEPGTGNILAGIPNWVIYAAAGGVLLFILLLILILVIARRRRKRREREEAEALAEQEALERELAIAAANAALAGGESGANVMTLQTEKSMELRQDIRKFVENNPEVAARLVSGWLKGGDDNG